MPYSEKLEKRITAILKSKRNMVVKKMFGGVCFMLKDKMIAGIVEDKLMIRCRKDDYDTLLKKPNASVMNFTGKPMKGFLYIEPAGIRTEMQLMRWIEVGIDFLNASEAKKKSK